MDASKTPTIELAKMYISENFDDKVAELVQKSVEKDLDAIPECPRVIINERILAEVEETLCKSIYTVNYRMSKQRPREDKQSDGLRVDMPDSLESGRQIVPVFPMRGKYCFLFNLETKDYDIQEFEKLDILPTYPSPYYCRVEISILSVGSTTVTTYYRGISSIAITRAK